jgi:hypothetical protein
MEPDGAREAQFTHKGASGKGKEPFCLPGCLAGYFAGAAGAASAGAPPLILPFLSPE